MDFFALSRFTIRFPTRTLVKIKVIAKLVTIALPKAHILLLSLSMRDSVVIVLFMVVSSSC